MAERPDTIWTRLMDRHFPTKSEREGEVSLPELENAELEDDTEPCSDCAHRWTDGCAREERGEGDCTLAPRIERKR